MRAGGERRGMGTGGNIDSLERIGRWWGGEGRARERELEGRGEEWELVGRVLEWEK